MKISVEDYKKLIGGSKPRNKYNNKPVTIDGVWFQSTAEGNRYAELKLLQQAGKISSLECQPVIQCVVNGEQVCKYIADFRYIESGLEVYEDVKSKETRKKSTYRLKVKLVLQCTGIKIVEVIR